MRVVGYDSLEPALLVAPGPARTPLRGRIELYPGERRCAGAFDDGEHAPCDAPVENSPFCRHHTEWSPCAACRGECLKDEMDCLQPHVVYLALFAPDVLKVGVTRRGRFRRRLREQGADAGEILAVLPDGREARRIEAAAPYSDRVNIEEKARGLHLEPESELLSEARIEFDYLEESLGSRPIRLGPGDPVVGEMVGVKGRLLVLESGGTPYAVDLMDLVGFELDGAAAPVQSSLNRF